MIEDLYYGGLNPSRYKRWSYKLYKKLEELCAEEEKINRISDNPTKEAFQKYQRIQDEIYKEDQLEAFSEGFKLGMMLANECFYN